MIASALSLIGACLSDPLLWEANYYAPGIFFLIDLPLLLLFLTIAATPVLIGATLLWFLIFRRRGTLLLVPLAISLAALAVTVFVNTTGWWLNYNDWRFGTARSKLFREIAANPPAAGTPEYFGSPVPSSSHSHLSIGTEPAYFRMTEKGPLVLFLTFEGIPDGFSGFLYSPVDIDPKKEWPELDLERADVWDKDRHIYFVGNR